MGVEARLSVNTPLSMETLRTSEIGHTAKRNSIDAL